MHLKMRLAKSTPMIISLIDHPPLNVLQDKHRTDAARGYGGGRQPPHLFKGRADSQSALNALTQPVNGSILEFGPFCRSVVSAFQKRPFAARYKARKSH